MTAAGLHTIRRRSAARRRPWAVDLVMLVAGLGLGVVIGLDVVVETHATLHAPGGWYSAAGRMTGMVGTYLLFAEIVLIARLPVLERTLGQDRLVRWHRQVAPYMLTLIVAHVVLIVIGYQELAIHTSIWRECWTILHTLPGMITATLATVLLLMAGFTSMRIARARMAYETWWIVHLYAYIGLGLSYSHILATGAPFIDHPFARWFWISLWIVTVVPVAVYRILLPIYRTLRHRLRVVAIHEEGADVTTIVCEGRALDRMPVSGGQYLQWRFLARGLWWQAHPYSLSAVPTATQMRVTVKHLGDHSQGVRSLRVGTRVAIEGPYGAFTADTRVHDRVVLIGAGVGITPLRAMLDDLPLEVRVDLIMRASTRKELVLHEEIAAHLEARGGTLHELVGPRSEVQLGAAELRALIPDLTSCDVFVCGPDGFMRGVMASARAAGVPAAQIHFEDYVF